MASRTPGSKLDVGMELERRGRRRRRRRGEGGREEGGRREGEEEEEVDVKRKMRLVVVDTDVTDLAYVPLLGEDCQTDRNSKGQTETQ